MVWARSGIQIFKLKKKSRVYYSELLEVKQVCQCMLGAVGVLGNVTSLYLVLHMLLTQALGSKNPTTQCTQPPVR